MTPGLLRSLMAEVGELAGVSAVYWQDGFYFYDAGTRSRAIVEQVREAQGFAGRIEIRTQRGDAGGLLAALAHLVKAHQDQLGVATGMSSVLRREGGLGGLIERITGRNTKRNAELHRAVERTSELLEELRDSGFAVLHPDGGRALAPAPVAPRALARLSPAPPPLPERAYYVSYAWGSTGPEAKPEDRLREQVVDRLCERKRREGITIIRDRDAMRFGDRISNFMRRMSEGQLIYVVLSGKYLRSEYCMYELYRIWERSGPPEDREHAFLERVRVIRLPDARISTPEDRLGHARYWSPSGPGGLRRSGRTGRSWGTQTSTRSG